MSQEFYSTPSANLDIRDTSRSSPVKAISIAVLVSFVGSMIVAMLIGIIYGIYIGTVGLHPDAETEVYLPSSVMYLAFIIEGALFSLWSGQYVAKKTNFKEYRYCIYLILICSSLSLIMFWIIPDQYNAQPLWYTIARFLNYPFAVLLGCWLQVKRT
ncbi:hypothetical protein FE810_05355 [Thalassotalea litorea]|uniref:Uncharacterized protein n=1 Tax=Thalassotalea litorea TaxID=2020715 RepID=A0A5R9IW50_9GAMM|nr:hypothetical protein [Thalassotalea litorea]TLU66148.1 hypothetical protein FE810_05355 [Thalassotalea litorea]